MRERERPCSQTFISICCCNHSISLLVIVANLLLCPIYKLNFFIGMYIGKKHSIYGVGYDADSHVHWGSWNVFPVGKWWVDYGTNLRNLPTIWQVWFVKQFMSRALFKPIEHSMECTPGSDQEKRNRQPPNITVTPRRPWTHQSCAFLRSNSRSLTNTICVCVGGDKF